MDNTQPAAFQLKGFSIPQFNFEEPPQDYTKIDIKLFPSGIYDNVTGEYTLNIAFRCISYRQNSNDDPKDVLNGVMKSDFEIDGNPEIKEIPSFFYNNSLAIMFPYIRGFISNITLQAGVRLLILPLLNLSNLSKILEENTVQIQRR